ncbi:ssDNA endonuclease and repair protein rad10 [Linnemannia gamsii]|uniref:SsDNA endonuclease and repair protein rad10 n=1 Tax=Linnemannia gamsii TaxID=64522 RepID=A0ABQ7K588_9FUNG|nr:ssDNA endonuclease and repair protein rad10 [Linnemannia gamsii]
MSNNKDKDTPSKGTTHFKLPSRAELEERRKQLEANKPAIHFKSKGIVAAIIDNNNKGLDADATNSAPSHSSASSSSTSASLTFTATTKNSNQVPGSSSLSTTPAIVSSRQHYQQQQQQQQSHVTTSKAAVTAEDDDFGFGDDLGDVNFNDDLFDDIDRHPTNTNLASTATPRTTLSSTPTQSVPSTSASSNTSTTQTSATNSTATATTSGGKTLISPPAFQPKSKASLVVKTSQRGNPLLQFIRNVPYEYGEVVPDFVVGTTSCVLFLSIRYHRLHPEYIFSRIASLANQFVLRILLVLVDVETHQHAIRELTRVAMVNDLTLVCAWSNEEAARYIETYKAYENKAPDAIKERVENDYLSKLTDGLTQIPSINKTDIVTLSSTFGSLKNIMDASADELGLLPGFGERKVRRLLEAFDQPFAIDPKKRRHKRL